MSEIAIGSCATSSPWPTPPCAGSSASRWCSTRPRSPRNEIPRHEPLIVLSRHCGPGDTVLVAWLLTVEYRLQVRIVLKAILRCEPVLDFAEQLGCLCFLARGGRARHQIHDLAASLAGGQAMLLFPEGANFTWPRWRTAIAELRSTGRIRAASRALRQSYTLPPTPEVPPLR